MCLFYAEGCLVVDNSVGVCLSSLILRMQNDGYVQGEVSNVRWSVRGDMLEKIAFQQEHVPKPESLSFGQCRFSFGGVQRDGAKAPRSEQRRCPRRAGVVDKKRTGGR